MQLYIFVFEEEITKHTSLTCRNSRLQFLYTVSKLLARRMTKRANKFGHGYEHSRNADAEFGDWQKSTVEKKV
ncbi:hypothetical protein WH47_00507 [Habropoda laboriosa]|uniref:Uncharacterized protein n=1 Tax=Habropoda laboriosa TaxID=597456 RepID=A0A0L7R3S7_9HYME|nr:hypothetical protein WH47_00507 [Habropoda laboriosa]